MEKKGRTRWELGCFDSFESPFLKELHKIREEQARKTKKLSPKELVEFIRYQAEKLKREKSEKYETN